YVIASSGDFVGSSLMGLLGGVMAGEEVVEVVPRRAYRRASRQHAEVAARRHVRLDLGRVRQQVLDREHRGRRREHVGLAGDREHRLRYLAQVERALVGERELALRELVDAEEAVVELAERTPGVGEHVR